MAKMARRLSFKPSLKRQLALNQAAQDFYEMSLPVSDPRYKAAQLRANQRAKAQMEALALAKPRAAPRKLEAPVVAAISELLAVHPRVIWAARMNSGAAGEHSQVRFHWFVRKPEPIRMPDFIGQAEHSLFVTQTRMIAIEVKAPGWTKPRDDRERGQAAFLKMIRDAGGIGIFATSADDVAKALA